MNHRDHVNAVRAKRIWSELEEEEDGHIEELLASDQQREHEMPVYREPVRGERE